jgi:esterase
MQVKWPVKKKKHSMKRLSFSHDGLTLSFLDSGDGFPLVALHGHWMEAATFAPFAETFPPRWRLIALDQRGHGFSDHVPSYTRVDYLGDIVGLLDHLGLRSAVLLGYSLGGVNAYQFAARFPDRVAAMIIEDIGAVINGDTGFALPWAGLYATRAALEERIGERLVPELTPSIRETAAGWTLAFDPHDTVQSQKALNGDHWDDWLASSCPALLIGGRDSHVTDSAQLEQMATRRPNTKLVTLAGGHVVHFDNPEGFATTVGEFLDQRIEDSLQ